MERWSYEVSLGREEPMVRAREYVQCPQHGWVEAGCPRCPLPGAVEGAGGQKEAPPEAEMERWVTRLEQDESPALRSVGVWLRTMMVRVAALEKRLDGDGK